MKEMTVNDSNNPMYGSFYLGHTEFAIPAPRIEQVVGLPSSCIEIPQSPDFVRCTFNLRGTVITVLDLEILFGIPKTGKSSEESVAVLEFEDQCIGLLFETTGEVFRGVPEELSEFESETRTPLIQGVFKRCDGARLVQVIDVESLFRIPEVPRDSSRKSAHGQSSQSVDRGVKTQYMTFKLEGSICGLPISSVQEVFQIDSIGKSILSGGACIGLAELRGGTVPVLDLAALLRSNPTQIENADVANHDIIVMRCESELFGLLVDSIDGIISAYPQEMTSFPTQDLLRTDLFQGCIVKEGQSDVIVFNQDSLLMDEEIKEITRVHANVANSPLRLLSKSKKDEANEHKVTYLSFTAGARFAVPIHEIQEIIDLPSEMMQPPGMRDCFAGVVNLRGHDIVAIVDLRQPSDELSEEPFVDGICGSGQVMIFKTDGGMAGLVVDSVDSITSFQESEKLVFQNSNGEYPGTLDELVETISLTDKSGEKVTAVMTKMQTLLENVTGPAELLLA